MRIIPMVLAALCASLAIYAQDLPFANNLRPAELIQNAHTQRLKFTQYEDLLQTETTTIESDFSGARSRTFDLLDERRGELIHAAPAAWQLTLADPTGQPVELELVRVQPFTDDFRITTAGGEVRYPIEQRLFYRGVVRGQSDRSLAAITVGPDGLTGMVNFAGGDNLVLRPLPRTEAHPERVPHVLTVDQEDGSGFECHTPDSGIGYAREELSAPAGGARSTGCVRVYFEVDYDIYQSKGGVNETVNYVTALWNQVATLYANDGISAAISEIKVWNTPSPYSGSSSSTLLSQFQSTRTSFNGDIGQLLSYQASGGIAVLGGLCHPYTAARLSFSSIGGNFSAVPTYSWSVMVVAHELGHLLGSQHTHACVWNGNNTAIDGCAGFTEGNCGNPGTPAGGGTLMSYCHVTSAGIDFTKGFGTQPRNVILNKINSSTCLTTCGSGGGSGGGTSGGDTGGGDPDPGGVACTGETAYLTLRLDNYGMETKWRLYNAANQVVAKGGPYLKEESGRTVRDTLCLPEGCYRFSIEDSHEDGICCAYGEGSYRLTNAENQVLAEGAEFAAAEETSFCLPFDPNGGGGDCNGIDFAAESVLAYGGSQDAGQHQVLNTGQTLYILNNAWKAIDLNYTITPNTVLEFDFRSTKRGEIHGIGFDDDDFISSSLTFRVYGSQYWGISDFANYPGNGTWKTYSIPVGQYYTGTASKLFFTADHDGGTRDGNSYFRNVRIHEGSGCANLVPTENTNDPATYAADDLRIYPNPTSAAAWLEVNEPQAGTGQWTVRDLTGRVVRQGEATVQAGANRLPLELTGLSAGSYFLQWTAFDRERQTRLTVAR